MNLSNIGQFFSFIKLPESNCSHEGFENFIDKI